MAPEAKAGGPRSAAFFDLDRTLLAGASGPAISAALRTAGLMGDRGLPGQDFLFQAFNIFGENRPAMMLTRQAASLAANWSRERRSRPATSPPTRSNGWSSPTPGPSSTSTARPDG